MKIYGLVVQEHVVAGITATQTFHFTTPTAQEQFIAYLTTTETDLEVKGVFEVLTCDTVEQAVAELTRAFGPQHKRSD